MKNQNFLKQKLTFFQNEAYYKKGESLPVNLQLFDRGRKYEFQRIIKFAHLPKEAKIIELGAGYGKYVLPLLYLGYKVTAVDIGEKLLTVIKKTAKKNNLDKKLKTIHSDFKTSVIKNEYDTALCISTFHLLSDTEKERCHIFSNLIKSVKPGGSVVVVEPNPFNPFLYILYFFTNQASWSVEKYFLKSTVWNLKRIFKNCGLSEITISYVGFLPLRYLKFPGVVIINYLVNKVPLLNIFSSFIYIKGIKKGIKK